MGTATRWQIVTAWPEALSASPGSTSSDVTARRSSSAFRARPSEASSRAGTRLSDRPRSASATATPSLILGDRVEGSDLGSGEVAEPVQDDAGHGADVPLGGEQLPEGVEGLDPLLLDGEVAERSLEPLLPALELAPALLE